MQAMGAIPRPLSVPVYLLHAVSLGCALLRMGSKLFIKRKIYWCPDLIFLLAVISNTALLAALIIIDVAGREFISPRMYVIAINTHFYVIWLMRASLATLLIPIVIPLDGCRDRVYHFLAVILCLSIATAYCVTTTLTCKDKEAGWSSKTTIHPFPTAILVVAPLSGIVVDTFMAFVAGRVIIRSNMSSAQKACVVSGIWCGASTMAIDSVWWILTATIFPSRPSVHVCLASFASCFSLTMGCMSTVARLVYQRIQNAQSKKSKESHNGNNYDGVSARIQFAVIAGISEEEIKTDNITAEVEKIANLPELRATPSMSHSTKSDIESSSSSTISG